VADLQGVGDHLDETMGSASGATSKFPRLGWRRRSVVIVSKRWGRAAGISVDSDSVIASRLLRAGAKARALRRLVTERRRQAAALELAQHARRGDRDGQSAPVNDVYLPLTSATQARPIVVRARIAQRSLAVWALAQLDIREQELWPGSPVAHAPCSPKVVSEAGGKQIRAGPS
jgi:hypothetical protein